MTGIIDSSLMFVVADCVVSWIDSLDTWIIYSTPLHDFSFLDIATIINVVAILAETYVELIKP